MLYTPFFRGPFIFAVERFLHFAHFYFRGFSLTVYENYTILSVILHFADFYFRGNRANREKRGNKMSAKKGIYSIQKVPDISFKSDQTCQTKGLPENTICETF